MFTKLLEQQKQKRLITILFTLIKVLTLCTHNLPFSQILFYIQYSRIVCAPSHPCLNGIHACIAECIFIFNAFRTYTKKEPLFIDEPFILCFGMLWTPEVLHCFGMFWTPNEKDKKMSKISTCASFYSYKITLLSNFDITC